MAATILIVDADGNPMTSTHATKRAKRYRYYVSASLLAGDRSRAQKGMRVPAGDIEALVLERLRAFFSSRTDIGDALTPLDLEARAFDAALRNACTLSKRWLAAPLVEMKSLVRDIVEQITVAADRIEVRLSQAKIAAAESESAVLPLNYLPPAPRKKPKRGLVAAARTVNAWHAPICPSAASPL